MKRKISSSILIILCAASLLFVLSYYFNPMNDIMRRSLTGPVGWLVKMITRKMMLASGRFLLVTLLVGLPAFFLGPLFEKRAFLKTGLFSGFIFSTVSMLNFLILEKGKLEGDTWYIIAPSFAVVYFLLGFAGGGLWGSVGKRILPS